MSGHDLDMMVQSLFPAEVITHAMTVPALVENLPPAERACLDGAGLRRRLDLAGGRVCARRALAQLGIRDFPLPLDEKGEPVWPAGIVGNIAHCDGRCAAAVARRLRIRSLGLDMERLQELPAQITQLVCTPAELQWLHALPRVRQPLAVSLLLGAKECFYKCQFPLTQRWLDFHEVSIQVYWQDREFDAVAPACTAGAAVAFSRGRYVLHDGHVITGLTTYLVEESGVV